MGRSKRPRRYDRRGVCARLHAYRIKGCRLVYRPYVIGALPLGWFLDGDIVEFLTPRVRWPQRWRLGCGGSTITRVRLGASIEEWVDD